MTKDEFIHSKLARKGECWHKFQYIEGYFHCVKCQCWCSDKDINPDFTTWNGFGWMWERAKEKYPEFFDSDGRGVLSGDKWQVAPYCKEVFTSHRLINPIRLRDELAKYLGWEERNDKRRSHSITR